MTSGLVPSYVHCANVPMCSCAVVHCANVLFLMLVHSALYGVANSVFVTCLHTFVQKVLGWFGV